MPTGIFLYPHHTLNMSYVKKMPQKWRAPPPPNKNCIVIHSVITQNRQSPNILCPPEILASQFLNEPKRLYNEREKNSTDESCVLAAEYSVLRIKITLIHRNYIFFNGSGILHSRGEVGCSTPKQPTSFNESKANQSIIHDLVWLFRDRNHRRTYCLETRFYCYVAKGRRMFVSEATQRIFTCRTHDNEIIYDHCSAKVVNIPK